LRYALANRGHDTTALQAYRGHKNMLAHGAPYGAVANAVEKFLAEGRPAEIVNWPFGERLDRALGRDAALDFLKTVLRVSAEALLQGSSVRLARDRIEPALVMHLQRVDTTLLAVIIRQAGLAREIASSIAHFVAERQAQRPFDREGAERILEIAGIAHLHQLKSHVETLRRALRPFRANCRR
jgi:hypothetical protein